jgi:SanA protein
MNWNRIARRFRSRREPTGVLKQPKRKGFRTVLRRIRRLVLHGLIVMILVTVVGTLVIDFFVARIGKKFLRDATEISRDYDCIIVPGASVIANSIPSAILQDRLDTAYALYRTSGIERILVSGDHGTIFYDEVNVMRNYLVNKGVPPEAVFMDHAGFDTYQTLYRARDIFGVRRAVIVTQDFHLLRALYIGNRLGIDLSGVDSAIRSYGHDTRNRLREFPARVKAFLECEILRPEPYFLGEKIPIDGANTTIDDVATD